MTLNLFNALPDHPWRHRAALIAAVNAVAALFIGVVDVAPYVDGAVMILDVLVVVGIVKEGERHTTPVTRTPEDTTT